jgi:hypothetical protein
VPAQLNYSTAEVSSIRKKPTAALPFPAVAGQQRTNLTRILIFCRYKGQNPADHTPLSLFLSFSLSPPCLKKTERILQVTSGTTETAIDLSTPGTKIGIVVATVGVKLGQKDLSLANALHVGLDQYI